MTHSPPHQAIVLAAGLGTRLLPLTQKIPKPALPVGGIPILLFNLYLLQAAGIREIVLNLHHRPERIRKLLQGAGRLGLRLHYSLEPKILGTAGGIAQALAQMKRRSTFVLNGDILMDLDLQALARLHQKSGAKATLACVPKGLAKVSGFVESDAQGRIFRIAGGPPCPSPHPRLMSSIFSGVHLLEPELFEDYPRKAFGCIIRQIYQPALLRGVRLMAYRHAGSWWDLGSLKELKRADQLLWSSGASDSILKLWNKVRKWARPLFNHP